MRIDVQTRASDTLTGDSWYRFLASCKYTIGVEGGASLCMARTAAGVRNARTATSRRTRGQGWMRSRPPAFPGRDGEIDYGRYRRAISSAARRGPARCWSRASTTGSCIQAATTFRCEPTSATSTRCSTPFRRTRTASAWWRRPTEDVVASGAFACPERLVREVEGVALAAPPLSADSRALRVRHRANRFAERFARFKVAVYVVVATGGCGRSPSGCFRSPCCCAPHPAGSVGKRGGDGRDAVRGLTLGRPHLPPSASSDGGGGRREGRRRR